MGLQGNPLLHLHGAYLNQPITIALAAICFNVQAGAAFKQDTTCLSQKHLKYPLIA
jgi:hypothetical protein